MRQTPPWSLSRDALRILAYLQRVDARTGDVQIGVLAVTRQTLIDKLALDDKRALAACGALLQAGYIVSPSIHGVDPLTYVGLSERGKRAARRVRIRASSPEEWKPLPGEFR